MTTVIFKATEECNSRCAYCAVVRKNHQGPTIMPAETLERFFVRINAYLSERPEDHLKIIWHGGEPLTLGPDYFYRALELQQKHCADTSGQITHEMQSNLTLFSRKFTDVFRKMGITSFGTSYDPRPGIRGAGKTPDTREYNRRFLDALSLLEEEGFTWGVIYVVTKQSLQNPLEIFRLLTNINPAGSVMFNPVTFYKTNPVDLAITAEEFADFLGALFPYWWENHNRFSGVEPFYSLKQNILDGDETLICTYSGKCGETHFSVGPSGAVSQCGRSADWRLMDNGSIHDRSLSEIMADPRKQSLLKRVGVLMEGDCGGCRFWNICHGGCPLDALAEQGTIMRKSPSCCINRKGFIEKYFEPITGVRYRAREIES